MCSCRPVEAVQANIECNATSAVVVTHHFLQRMVSSWATAAVNSTTSHGHVQWIRQLVPYVCSAEAELLHDIGVLLG